MIIEFQSDVIALQRIGRVVSAVRHKTTSKYSYLESTLVGRTDAALTLSPLIAGSLLVTLLGVGGCAVGPDFKAPAAPPEAAYTEQGLPKSTVEAPVLGGAAQHFGIGKDIPAQWWTLFRSPEIDALVREAIANSPTLESAKATLRQAHEILKANEGGLLLPSVSASAQGARERLAGATLGLPYNPEFTLLNASVNASYNLDVFGGARRQIEGYAAQLDYTRYQLEATYLTLTSSVVTTAMREAGLRAQVRATEEIADAQAKQLDVVRQQFAVGAIPRATVLQQQTQLATTRASLPGLQKQLAQTRNQLAVLIGKTPSVAQLPVINLEALTLPTQLPVSLPSELVRQRPDIQASEAQLHQASAQVGVATAAQLPQFTLSAQYGVEGTQPGHLLSPANTIWSLAGGVVQPIFNGGQLSAQRRAASAAYDAAYAQYRTVVLQAFQNVADTLVALEADARTLAANAEADDLARQTLDLAQVQYGLGAVSYLTLLDTQRQFQQAHISLVQAQAARFADTATLFQALGGGWWNRTQPPADTANAAADVGSHAQQK